MFVAAKIFAESKFVLATLMQSKVMKSEPGFGLKSAELV